jgi:membrane protease YdiL (CAAX protease family)
MNWADILMAAALIVGLPGYVALVRYPRLKAAVAAGIPRARLSAYREGILVQWSLVAAAVLIWLNTHPPESLPRTLGELGLGFEGGLRFYIGLGLTLLAMVLLLIQRVYIVGNPENAAKAKKEMGNLGPLLPRTTQELNTFTGLSITAGLCEETLYRGFLMGILFPLVGTWGAVALASVFFGAGHIYQGQKGVIQTFVVGLLLALLYVLTQSLWLPMLLHGFLDWNSGTIAHHVMNLYPENELRDQAKTSV